MKKLLASLLLGIFATSFALPTFADEQDTSVQATTTPEMLTASTTAEQPTFNLDTTPTENIPATATETLPAPTDSNTLSEEVIVKLKSDPAIHILSTEGETAEVAADRIEQNPLVEYAEPNYERGILTLASSSDDTFAGNLWALENRGQTLVIGTTSFTGTKDDDIKGALAWTISEGTSTVVAVIDSGVMYTHTDLVGSMWDGAACKDGQGAALGSCIHGYDFADNDTNPAPIAASSSFSHGTHVAGIIAATKNNHTGIVGVAPSAKIMALRFGFDVASEVRAIDFARQNGAKIINASFGGTQFSQTEYDAIKRFTDAGGLFVAAAGNSASSSDISPIYPAAYDLPGIISVAATNQNDGLASFSNFGTTTIDIGAPGVNILSTYTTDTTTSAYAYADGTSMAAPQVAGVVALLESKYPTLASSIIKSDILKSGDSVTSLASTTVSGKRLNAYAALTADITAPVITLNGSNPLTLIIGDLYTDPGAIVVDDQDGTTTATSSETVDTSVATTTYVTYNAVDSHGNQATPVVRTVIVNAPAAPVVQSGGGGGGSSVSVSSSSGQSSSSNTSTTNPARPALTTSSVSTTTPMLPISGIVKGASTYRFTRSLKLRMSGADVTALQQALTRAGVYSGPITGYFGVLTAAGVRGLQAAHGLEPVGSVGPMTRNLLNSGI